MAEELHVMYPDAPVFTSAARPSGLPRALEGADIRTSFLQHAPGISRAYRMYLPLYPRAFRSLPLHGYRLVLASSSAWAHTVRTDGALVVYCHTPPRFLWQTDEYLKHEGAARKAAARFLTGLILRKLREDDLRAAERARVLIANSRAVAARISNIYGRTAEVVAPPVETARFLPGEKRGYALVVSRLQAYKRIHLAIRACEELRVRLLVVGTGPARGSLQREAGKMTTFLGRLEDNEVGALMGSAEVLIFPGEEDFGITPLEANASGCPVVAFAGGGALDTVANGVSGVLFRSPTVESLKEALETALSASWDRDKLVRHAATFGPERFRTEIKRICERVAPPA